MVWVFVTALATVNACAQESSRADAYPAKPIRFIVPYPPGGPNDVLARLIGQKLNERWGQAVVIENRAGAAGLIGAELAARAPGDGYTLFMGNTSILTINPSLHAKLPYDPEKDFLPVNYTVAAPLILALHPSTTVRSVPDLLKLARSRPGQFTYASAGSGGVAHLSGELLKYLAKIDMIHIPYKGTGPAVIDVVAGQVSMTFTSTVSAMPQINSGKLRGIAVTTPARAPSLPDIPSIAETVPGYDVSPWYGVLVPAGTPAAIVTRLYDEIHRIVTTPDVAQRLTNDGGTVVSAGPAEFASRMKAERAKWAKVVKAAHIRLD